MEKRHPDIVTLAAGAVLVVLLVIVLYLARAILLPIVTSVVLTLILIRAADALGRLPLLRVLSETLRRFLVLIVMAGILFLLGLIIADMVDRIAQVLPVYEANIEALMSRLAERMGLDDTELWPQLSRAFRDFADLQSVGLFLFSSAGGLVGTVFLIVVYSGFLIAERGALDRKLSRAFGDEERTRHIRELLARISDSFSEYLATKTLINVILAVLSYAVMRFAGLDFALFWAVMIGLFNYIPYVGSFIGVFFPVLLSLGQFGSLTLTLVLAGGLTVMQVLVGNLLDPWLVGRRVNLSPFVVMVALVAWSSIWGLPGAILAVPLTSALAITCAAFPASRPIAVLLSSGENIDAVPASDKA